VITPQLFWSKRIRTSITASFIISIFVNIGMWFERFVITVTSLNRDFLPSSWRYFVPTNFDYLFLIGSFGLFFSLFLLFIWRVPVVALAEVKGIMKQSNPHAH
jgi:molybdopterin-containing oxidoreductase family membrane subunit